jgi:hypothetical protein
MHEEQLQGQIPLAAYTEPRITRTIMSTPHVTMVYSLPPPARHHETMQSSTSTQPTTHLDVHWLSSNENHTSVDIVVVLQVALLIGAECARACRWSSGRFWCNWERKSGGQAGEDKECDLHDVDCC